MWLFWCWYESCFYRSGNICLISFASAVDSVYICIADDSLLTLLQSLVHSPNVNTQEAKDLLSWVLKVSALCFWYHFASELEKKCSWSFGFYKESLSFHWVYPKVFQSLAIGQARRISAQCMNPTALVMIPVCVVTILCIWVAFLIDNLAWLWPILFALVFYSNMPDDFS